MLAVACRVRRVPLSYRSSQFAPLVHLDARGGASPLERIAVERGRVEGSFDEAWLQDLIFRHPELLPVGEISPSHAPLIPACRELGTPVGPLDALFVNPEGELTLVECKLWRNPQARREVVGQILDYTKEFTKWSYEDLQREVSRARKESGNVLPELARQVAPDLDDAAFIDSVSRNLRNGRFLLLIVGDGIREGVESIVDFVETHASLQFTLALTELAVFRLGAEHLIVQPRVLARTALVRRHVVELASEGLQLTSDEPGKGGGRRRSRTSSASTTSPSGPSSLAG